jgi:hypothetical protein
MATRLHFSLGLADGEGVTICSKAALDRVIGDRTDMAAIHTRAEADLAERQARWDPPTGRLIIPVAPASRAFSTVTGLWSAIRTIGAAPRASTARIMFVTVSIPNDPCSMSMMTKSSPERAWASQISALPICARVQKAKPFSVSVFLRE